MYVERFLVLIHNLNYYFQANKWYFQNKWLVFPLLRLSQSKHWNQLGYCLIILFDCCASQLHQPQLQLHLEGVPAAGGYHRQGCDKRWGSYESQQDEPQARRTVSDLVTSFLDWNTILELVGKMKLQPKHMKIKQGSHCMKPPKSLPEDGNHEEFSSRRIWFLLSLKINTYEKLSSF